jgi:hypothetical protein
MAFPTISQIVESQDSSAGTSHAVTIPSGLMPGDVLLLVEFCSWNASLAGHPDGFSKLARSPSSDPSGNVNVTVRGYEYKNALLPILGVERSRPVIPGGVLSLTTAASTKSCVYALAFAEKDISLSHFLFALATGGGTAMDAPNLAYSGSAKDVLWMAFGVDGEDVFGGHPASYSLYQNDGVIDLSNTFGGPVGICGMSGRELNGTSENPGAFGGSSPSDWSALTMGIALGGP